MSGKALTAVTKKLCATARNIRVNVLMELGCYLAWIQNARGPSFPPYFKKNVAGFHLVTFLFHVRPGLREQENDVCYFRQ